MKHEFPITSPWAILVIVVALILAPVVLAMAPVQAMVQATGVSVKMKAGWDWIPGSPHMSYIAAISGTDTVREHFTATQGWVTLKVTVTCHTGQLDVRVISAGLDATQYWSGQIDSSGSWEYAFDAPYTGGYILVVDLEQFGGDFDISWQLGE